MDVASIAAELRRERSRLVGERARIEDEIGEEFQPDAEDRPPDLADRGPGGSVEEALDNVLRQIEAALERIDVGAYGVCERCGEPIAAVRLEALRYAVRCVDCCELRGPAGQELP